MTDSSNRPEDSVPNSGSRATLASQDLAILIVDALVVAGIIKQQDMQRAMSIVVEEIDVRKALGDY